MSTFGEKFKEIWGKVCQIYRKAEEVISIIYRCIFRLRKVFLAIPVVYLAIRIAIANLQRLPEAVGINMQSNGEFAMMVTRNYAVYGPLGVTLFCLILMFFSRKTIYPWIISIFTLALPYLLYFTNMYSF